jgi:glycosyltransferase involved in cell wall biosynthesis
LPQENLSQLVVGVDVNRFSPERFTPEKRQEVRDGLSIPADGFVVGIVARMVKEKGFAELFQALSMLQKSIPNIYLVHVGFVDRSRGDEVTEEMAKHYGIADHCRFLGPKDDVPPYLSAMDVYCLPSYREGYPVSVMEASAMALPCVVSDVRGCREAVVHEQTGLVVPVKNPEAIAGAISMLYADKNLRLRLGTSGRQRAVAVFDENKVLAAVIEKYRSLLKLKQRMD